MDAAAKLARVCGALFARSLRHSPRHCLNRPSAPERCRTRSSHRAPKIAAEAGSEGALREQLRGSLRAWSELALESTGQHPAAHHLRLIEELEATAAGRSGRLLVHMPPGAAKSTYASVLFPAWWLARKSAAIADRRLPHPPACRAFRTSGSLAAGGAGATVRRFGVRRPACGAAVRDRGGRPLLCDRRERAGGRAARRPVADRRSGAQPGRSRQCGGTRAAVGLVPQRPALAPEAGRIGRAGDDTLAPGRSRRATCSDGRLADAGPAGDGRSGRPARASAGDAAVAGVGRRGGARRAATGRGRARLGGALPAASALAPRRHVHDRAHSGAVGGGAGAAAGRRGARSAPGTWRRPRHATVATPTGQ